MLTNREQFKVATEALKEMIDNPTLKYVYKESARTIKWLYDYADLKAEYEQPYFHCMPASYIVNNAEKTAKLVHYLTKYSKYVKAKLKEAENNN